MKNNNKYYIKKEYIILGVTADEYELPVITYSTISEMANDLNITNKQVYTLLHHKRTSNITNLKYIKIKLGE